MTDADFNLMLTHLAEPRNRMNVRKGTLAITMCFSCVIANGMKCKTLCDLTSVTSAVRS